MEALQNFFDWLGGYVWGAPLLILLGGTAIYLSFRLLFLQVHMLPMALKQAFSPPKEHEKDHEGDISHFGALMTALSATIGTGNIAGVATAIVSGGPGAVFWMWITAFFGMATKYGEAVLAVKYRITNDKGEMSGGPMYYIERGLGIKWLAVLFALFGVLASFGIGSSVQANSVAQAIHASFHIDPWITGVVLTVLTAVVVLGGIQSISKATSFIVPFMAISTWWGGWPSSSSITTRSSRPSNSSAVRPSDWTPWWGAPLAQPFATVWRAASSPTNPAWVRRLLLPRRPRRIIPAGRLWSP